MQVLVIGGGGPIGQAAARAFAARGDSVWWTSRQQAPLPGLSDGQVQADRRQPSDILRLVRDRRIDLVVDAVAYVAADTLPLLSALDGQVGRYAMLSSSDVYRNYGLLHRLEAGDPDPGPLSERSPLRTRAFPYRGAEARTADDPSRWMDDYDKIPLETAVAQMSSDWTTLRLPMVYGPGDRHRRFRWAIAPMLAGAAKLEAPRSWLAWTTTYGFLDNVGAAIAHAAAHPMSARRTFNLADEPAMDHSAWVARFRVATGWAGEVQPTDGDTPFARALADLDLSVPIQVSAERLVSDLGFTPPVDSATAARLTAADEAAR